MVKSNKPTFTRNDTTYGGVGNNPETWGVIKTFIIVFAIVFFLDWIF